MAMISDTWSSESHSPTSLAVSVGVTVTGSRNTSSNTVCKRERISGCVIVSSPNNLHGSKLWFILGAICFIFAALARNRARRKSHLAQEDAAAHEPGVDVEAAAVDAADDDDDEAMVAELVVEPEREAAGLGISRERLYVAFGTAARRQIELVALVYQLNDSRNVGGREFRNRGAHLERLQIGAHIGRLRQVGLAARLGPILAGALDI